VPQIESLKARWRKLVYRADALFALFYLVVAVFLMQWSGSGRLHFSALQSA